MDDEVRKLNADSGWRDAMVSYEMILQDERRRARKEGLAEGRREGLAEGREEIRDKEAAVNRKLVAALEAADRMDELAAAIVDPTVKARYLAEFGIDS